MKKNTKTASNNAAAQGLRPFWGIFNYRYKWIESINPYLDLETGALKKGKNGKLKPDWRRKGTDYPIRFKTLESIYQNPAELIGLSFGVKTYYCCLDIDWLSKYHPQVNETGFRDLLGKLEEIGLVRPIFIRSGFSGGLHIYYFFNEEIGTFNLACAMQGILAEHGIKPQSGTLELFPNTKPHKQNKRDSFYNGLKLPLQPMTGSCILNDDFQPIGDDLATFEKLAASSAVAQDLETLKLACKKYAHQIRLQRCGRSGKSLKKLIKDLERAINQQFTGRGQTNYLLLDIGAYGVIVKRLDEPDQLEELTEYIKETITNMAGYEKYCGHQHEIEKRCQEVAKSSQNYYWAAGKPRKREKITYKDNFGNILNNAQNGNQAKALNATQKIEEILTHIQQQVREGLIIPRVKSSFLNLIIETSKKLFKRSMSKSTLYKSINKKIWETGFAAALLASVQLTMTTPVEAAASPKVINQEIKQEQKQEVKKQEERKEVKETEKEETKKEKKAEINQEQIPAEKDQPKQPKTSSTKTCTHLGQNSSKPKRQKPRQIKVVHTLPYMKVLGREQWLIQEMF